MKTSTQPEARAKVENSSATLGEALSQRRHAILQGWRDRILAGYPDGAAAFFGKRKDRFANPVGHTIGSQTQVILDALLAGATADEMTAQLRDLIKQRAIQEMKPSEAVGFVFQLRDAIREELRAAPLDVRAREELRDLEDELGRLALHAFDVFCSYRETIHQIRMNEYKRNVATLLRRAAIRSDGEETSRP